MRALAFATLAALCLASCGNPVPDVPPDTAPDAACADASGSFFLSKLTDAALTVDGMHPMLLSTKPEHVTENCPVELRVMAGAGAPAKLMRDYICWLGRIDLGTTPSASGLANDAARGVAQAWAVVRRAFEGGAECEPPVRAVIKHYRHMGAPGRCITIQATFYTVPDPYLDSEFFMRLSESGQGIEGVLVTLRKTYQTEAGAHESGEPRLVEILIEAESKPQPGTKRPTQAALMGVPEIALDPERDAHFEDLGSGSVWGVAWVDRSYGRGEARPWSGAYRIHEGKAQVTPLPAAWKRALLDFIPRL